MPEYGQRHHTITHVVRISAEEIAEAADLDVKSLPETPSVRWDRGGFVEVQFTIALPVAVPMPGEQGGLL